MRLLRFSLDTDAPQIGVMEKDGFGIIPVSAAAEELKDKTMLEVIRLLGEDPSLKEKLQAALSAIDPEDPDGNVISPDDDNVKLLAPIPHPIHDVICVGVNYSQHLKETEDALGDHGFVKPPATIYFGKRANRILGPDDRIHARFDADPELDYECELAVIIGRSGTHIPAEKAEEYIFGYSVFNDISARKTQREHSQWYLGKSFDDYTAMGPWIVTKDELSYPPLVQVRSIVNGEIRQNSDTRMFIHQISEMIEELSACFTLEAGDIIATGTPSGVGMGFHPPKYMKAGDEVICEIEGIGALRNTVTKA